MRHPGMVRAAILAACLVVSVSTPAPAEVLLSPHVQARGVDGLVARAFESLLVPELERRLDCRLIRADTPGAAARPCTDAPCAARAARRAGTDGALLASLARRGDRLVAEVQRVDPSGRVLWSHEQAVRDDVGLEMLAARLGEACKVALPGTPSTEGEDTTAATPPVPMPADRTTQGPRVGNLYPAGHSYGGTERLSSLSYVWRYQTADFEVESVPALGLTWGGDGSPGRARVRDWTLLDLFVAWSPAAGDFAPYIGGGMGLHAVKLTHETTTEKFEESATTLQLSVGTGVLLFANHDFQVAVDLRYRHLLDDFPGMGGLGARGLGLSVGIHHR